MDKLKKVLSGQDNEERNDFEQVIESNSLSFGTRIKAFIACFVTGIVCSVMGTCLLWVPIKGTILFAIFYTLGNISSIGRFVCRLLYVLPFGGRSKGLRYCSAYCSSWQWHGTAFPLSHLQETLKGNEKGLKTC
ncbi:vesicle transport protein SFT2B-like isoform X4 [Spea bombifrons]|uniref:vesicle transport protein SFT2B-like isoform X4 n=1 Tax=Spea bombifrons TaxID=233779 RepID=UPI00234982AC|nr:vesicle transport protein SFT2B-like isoform X4 [Spea bombifrons]